MIKVRITRKELVAGHACAEGLAYSDTLAKRGVLTCDWTCETQVRFAVEAKAWIGWVRKRNMVPINNLRGADLIRANLRGAYLRGADLSCANLRGAIKS